MPAIDLDAPPRSSPPLRRPYPRLVIAVGVMLTLGLLTGEPADRPLEVDTSSVCEPPTVQADNTVTPTRAEYAIDPQTGRILSVRCAPSSPLADPELLVHGRRLAAPYSPHTADRRRRRASPDPDHPTPLRQSRPLPPRPANPTRPTPATSRRAALHRPHQRPGSPDHVLLEPNPIRQLHLGDTQPRPPGVIHHPLTVDGPPGQLRRLLLHRPASIRAEPHTPRGRRHLPAAPSRLCQAARRLACSSGHFVRLGPWRSATSGYRPFLAAGGCPRRGTSAVAAAIRDSQRRTSGIELVRHVPDAQDWYHQDDGGTPG